MATSTPAAMAILMVFDMLQVLRNGAPQGGDRKLVALGFVN
jgi:hypothetical protein